jgi:hypothetical protein
MTARGKPGKPKAGFPPFPPSLESPQKQRASHIPTASTTGPLYKGRLSKPGLTAEQKTVNAEGGPKQTAEMGQDQLPKPDTVSANKTSAFRVVPILQGSLRQVVRGRRSSPDAYVAGDSVAALSPRLAVGSVPDFGDHCRK